MVNRVRRGLPGWGSELSVFLRDTFAVLGGKRHGAAPHGDSDYKIEKVPLRTSMGTVRRPSLSQAPVGVTIGRRSAAGI